MAEYDIKRVPALRFWVLTGFLVLIFLTGGSSWPNVPSLMILRPFSILVLGYALFMLRGEDVRFALPLVAFVVAVVALTALHLMPLPPSLWHALPGRQLVADIDTAVGLGKVWRPLSVAPKATINALFFLITPLAVLLMTIQLTALDRLRLLYVIIALMIVSGLIGLLQTIGASYTVYSFSAPNAGFFANRNHQGVLLASMLPMLAVASEARLFSWLPPRSAKILAIAIAIVLVPLIIVTGSRAGMVAMVAALLLVPALRLRLIVPQSRQHSALRRRWSLLLGSLTIAGLVALVVLSARDVAIERMGVISEDIRYPVWVSVVNAASHYMPWGSGIGTYISAYQVYEPTSLLRPTYSNHAHNDWLEVLFTAGIPGGLLLLSAVGLFIAGAWRAVSAPGVTGLAGRLGLITVLLLALGSAVDYPLRTAIASSMLVIAAVWAIPTEETKHEG
jgi:O-antigen ligase